MDVPKKFNIWRGKNKDFKINNELYFLCVFIQLIIQQSQV